MPFQDRFRPGQIACPIMRSRLYREIRRQQPKVDRDSWIEHVIAPGERLMPELIAYRVYKSWRFKWVVLAAAGLDDYRKPLEPGDTLLLPTVEWLRDRFRYYAWMAAVDVTPPPVRARAPLAAEKPGLSLPQDDSANQALAAALLALAEPTPSVTTADEVNDETLNRQRDAVDAKLSAVRHALQQLTLGDTGTSDEVAAAIQTMGQTTPLVKPDDYINDDSLNLQRDAIDTKLDAIRDALSKLGGN